MSDREYLVPREPSGDSVPVAVVLVNYFSSTLVNDRIVELHGGSPPQIIVVVDNSGSAVEATNLAAIAQSYDCVHIVDMGWNSGFGRAVNAGVKFVRNSTPIRAFLSINPDTQIPPEFIRDLYLAYSSLGEKQTIMAPAIFQQSVNSSRLWYAGGRIDRRRWRVTHMGYGSDLDSLNDPLHSGSFFETEFVTGAALLTTVDVWEELEGYRDDLFMYWEDVDLSIRAIEHNIALYVCSETVIAHDEGATSSTGPGKSALYYRYMARNRIVVAAASSSLKVALSAPFLFEGLKVIAAPLIRERQAGRLRKTASAFRGTLEGYTTAMRERRR